MIKYEKTYQHGFMINCTKYWLY